MTKKSAATKQAFEPAPQMEVVKENAVVRISVRKAKISKHGTLSVDYDEHHQDDTIASVSKDCPYLVHDDLLNAFAGAAPHLVILSEFKEMKMDGDYASDPSEYDKEDLEKIVVNGFQLSGMGDGDSVQLFGRKNAEYGAIEIKGQKIAYESKYPFATELHETINHMRQEVLQYLDGKHSFKQLEIGFDEAEEESEAVEE